MDDFVDCWAVVNHNSSPGVAAVMEGIPVILTDPERSQARDVATQVSVPEFDGRIITVPFSFKEIDSEGLISYVPDPERCDRVAGLAVNYATLRRVGAPDKRVALMFSAIMIVRMSPMLRGR